MRLLASLCVALTIGGCSATRPPSPPSDTALPTSDTALRDVRCAQAARLAGLGEHKPAVDELASITERGGACSEEALAAVAESRRLLAEADELAIQGREAWRAGDLGTARELFQQALVVYPKYYWVQKLANDLPTEPEETSAAVREQVAQMVSAGRREEALELIDRAAGLAPLDAELAEERTRLRNELGDSRLERAHHAQRDGQLPQAIEWTQKAIAAQPEHPVRERVVDFARRLGLHLYSAGELVKAQGIWLAALALDETNELLREYLGEVEERLHSLKQIEAAGVGDPD